MLLIQTEIKTRIKRENNISTTGFFYLYLSNNVHREIQNFRNVIRFFVSYKTDVFNKNY